MGENTLAPPPPARLLLAVLRAPDGPEDWQARVQEQFGPILHQTTVFQFAHTSYYEPEMGQPLVKVFLAFDRLVSRESLVEIKLRAMDLERQLSRVDQTRRINLDPMLLSPENLVIATSKPFPHRVYLREGVFADVAFVCQGGAFKSLPWTYSDYSAQLDFFERVRKGLPASAKFTGTGLTRR
jgi:hypothetical protein